MEKAINEADLAVKAERAIADGDRQLFQMRQQENTGYIAEANEWRAAVEQLTHPRGLKARTYLLAIRMLDFYVKTNADQPHWSLRALPGQPDPQTAWINGTRETAKTKFGEQLEKLKEELLSNGVPMDAGTDDILTNGGNASLLAPEALAKIAESLPDK